MKAMKFAGGIPWLIIDYLYECGCKNNENVTLSCGDSFCISCISQIRCRSEFYKRGSNRYIKVIDNTVNGKCNLNNEYFKCPKCLSYANISKS